MTGTEQQVSAIRLQSFLRLYSSLDLDKLGRFTDCSARELPSLLLAYKLRVGFTLSVCMFRLYHDDFICTCMGMCIYACWDCSQAQQMRVGLSVTGPESEPFIPRSTLPDLDFRVQGAVLVTGEGGGLAASAVDRSLAAERMFLAGGRKHAEIRKDILRSFASVGL